MPWTAINDTEEGADPAKRGKYYVLRTEPAASATKLAAPVPEPIAPTDAPATELDDPAKRGKHFVSGTEPITSISEKTAPLVPVSERHAMKPACWTSINAPRADGSNAEEPRPKYTVLYDPGANRISLKQVSSSEPATEDETSVKNNLSDENNLSTRNKPVDESQKAQLWFEEMMATPGIHILHVHIAAWAIYNALPNKPGSIAYKEIAKNPTSGPDKSGDKLNKIQDPSNAGLKNFNINWKKYRSCAQKCLKSNDFFTNVATEEERKVIVKKFVGRANTLYREALVKKFRIGRKGMENSYPKFCKIGSGRWLSQYKLTEGDIEHGNWPEEEAGEQIGEDQAVGEDKEAEKHEEDEEVGESRENEEAGENEEDEETGEYEENEEVGEFEEVDAPALDDPDQLSF